MVLSSISDVNLHGSHLPEFPGVPETALVFLLSAVLPPAGLYFLLRGLRSKVAASSAVVPTILPKGPSP